MSSADDPRISTGSPPPDSERRRAPFKDRALALLYAVVIGVADGRMAVVSWLAHVGTRDLDPQRDELAFSALK
jgi:hypothetical protein